MSLLHRLPRPWTYRITRSPHSRADRRDFRVQWFDSWTAPIDEALAALPETATCPHELFSLIMRSGGPHRKRTAIVRAEGAPVAVIGLRQHGRHWEPVTQYVVPRAVAPALPGMVVPALAAVGVNIWTWGWEQRPSLEGNPVDVGSEPVYRVDLATDFEKLWRKSSLHRNIVTARKRCASMRFVVDEPGLDEWIIRNAAAAYGTTATADDELLATRHLARTGRAHTLALLDGDRPVAGSTAFVASEGMVIGQSMYRDPQYSRENVGTRLLDLQFHWARDAGFRMLDIGSGGRFDYKARWAPEAGRLWSFGVAPRHVRAAKSAVRLARRAQASSTGLLGQARRALGRANDTAP